MKKLRTNAILLFFAAWTVLLCMAHGAAQACLVHKTPTYNISEDAMLTCTFESSIHCGQNMCEQRDWLAYPSKYFLDFKTTEYSCPKIIGYNFLGEENETRFACKEKKPFTFQLSYDHSSCHYPGSFLVKTGTDEVGQAASFHIDRQTGEFVSFINTDIEGLTDIRLGHCVVDTATEPKE
ncbi:MAG: hypothetical protein HND56_05955 [Pseudomonadota bacterium]|nr:hypothetical protein [Pseudomonadota bacterium]QKK05257.1 MAG: hypothetical protein HND56_05955 [Pseudomonadota bacterium]